MNLECHHQPILVTGGAGFIGSCFCRSWFESCSTPIVVIDKLTYAGNLDSLASIASRNDFAFELGDIGDTQFVNAVLAKYRPRAILNLAAESHVDRSIDGPVTFFETNVGGTFRLLEATRSYWSDLASADQSQFRFLQVSTDEVFGSLGTTGAFSETTAYAPHSPYSASKAAADHFVRSYFHTFGLPTMKTHCSNNFGPYQFPEKFIPTIILNAMAGSPIPIYGDGLQVRDWLHVEDHCDALRKVLASGTPGDTYNIGGNCERTNLQIAQEVCAFVDQLQMGPDSGSTGDLITHVEDRPGHDRRYAIDATKIASELGWSPTRSFADGLEATVRWYFSNTQWTKRVTNGSYRGERLGLDGVIQE